MVFTVPILIQEHQVFCTNTSLFFFISFVISYIVCPNNYVRTQTKWAYTHTLHCNCLTCHPITVNTLLLLVTSSLLEGLSIYFEAWLQGFAPTQPQGYQWTATLILSETAPAHPHGVGRGWDQGTFQASGAETGKGLNTGCQYWGNPLSALGQISPIHITINNVITITIIKSRVVKIIIKIVLTVGFRLELEKGIWCIFIKHALTCCMLECWDLLQLEPKSQAHTIRNRPRPDAQKYMIVHILLAS